MKRRFETEAKCEDCKGTGLYVGLAERDGMAVVCHTCKGTGCRKIIVNYEDFEGRKERKGIKRVIETNVGIITGEKDDLKLDHFGGMPYEDWKNGKIFPPKSEMRNFVCPAWWYQSANYDLKPNWEECIGWGTFSGCKCFLTKEKCWTKFDAEQLNK